MTTTPPVSASAFPPNGRVGGNAVLGAAAPLQGFRGTSATTPPTATDAPHLGRLVGYANDNDPAIDDDPAIEPAGARLAAVGNAFAGIPQD